MVYTMLTASSKIFLYRQHVCSLVSLFVVLVPMLPSAYQSCLSVCLGSAGMLPTPATIPGMMPQFQLPMGALNYNYLGQPITAAGLPNGTGMSDLTSLSAANAYAMHGMPGLPTTAAMAIPNPSVYLNSDLPNVQLQSKSLPVSYSSPML